MNTTNTNAASVCKRGDYSENEANGNLIAAAPELLAALRGMIRIWDGGGDSFARLQVIEKARAALAKADAL